MAMSTHLHTRVRTQRTRDGTYVAGCFYEFVIFLTNYVKFLCLVYKFNVLEAFNRVIFNWLNHVYRLVIYLEQFYNVYTLNINEVHDFQRCDTIIFIIIKTNKFIYNEDNFTGLGDK